MPNVREHPAPDDPSRTRWRTAWAVAAAYGAVFAFAFTGDWLGTEPVLDARENIAWAQAIASGDAPAEPMYRALLYPWILARLPVSAEALPQAATWLGIALHWLNAGLAGALAGRMWASRRCGRIAGLLYAVYPAALWFAVQPLDVTLGIACFLGSLNLALIGFDRVRFRPACAAFAAAGALCGLAVLARPHFLAAAAALPFLPFLGRRSGGGCGPTRARFGAAAALAVPIGVALAGQGAVNWRLSGQFRPLPWQGAYNLYAANQEGANGRFYKQSVSFDEASGLANTARMESERLYREAAGSAGSVAEMNAHWRERFFRSVAEDPLRWLALMGRKALYLLNDWEHYNNLSFEYHAERFAALRFNPLGWGLLMIGAFCGATAGWPWLRRLASLRVALVGAAFAAGVLLFYVSARFRLPLAPCLCLFAGGLGLAGRERLRTFGRRGALGLAAGVAALAAAAYGDWADARTRETFVQDEALLANAAARAGDDAAAARFAAQALARDPSRDDVRRTRALSLFNQWLAAEGERRGELWRELGRSLEALDAHNASTLFVAGVRAWREGNRQTARELWRRAVRTDPDAAGMSARALRVANGEAPSTPGGGTAWENLKRLLRTPAPEARSSEDGDA